MIFVVPKIVEAHYDQERAEEKYNMGSLGRPFNKETTKQAIELTLKLLRDEGYSAVTMDRVATELKVGRPGLYRRWPSRNELIMAAIGSVMRVGEIPDTGTVRGDLIEHARQSVTNGLYISHGITASTVVNTILVPEVWPLYFEQIGRQRRQYGRVILQRGIARNEIPAQVNGDLLLDMLSGSIFYHVYIQQASLRERDIHQIVNAIITSPPLIDIPEDDSDSDL